MAYLIRFCMAAGMALALVQAAWAKTGPSLLFDARTGEVMSQDRAGEPWYPASLTKLMTAYVVFRKIKEGRLRLDQQIPVSALAHSQPPSKIGVPAGKTITLDFALQALLVYSANDMAYVLAEAASGTMVSFVEEMNGVARNLGLTSTHFENPNGLFDPRQLTTARDIGVLAAVLLTEFPEHDHYFSQEAVTVGKRKLMNRNGLIRQMPEANGMKTGFVCNSGYNLVASASRNGRRLIAVVLGAPSGKGRADIAQMLLTDGFSRTENPAAPRIAQINNEALGAIVPADMTGMVCKGKAISSLTRAKDLAGWGVSLGTYDTVQTADMALRGRLISAAAMDAPGQSGVIRMPGKTGYAAMIWNIDQATSLSLCNAFREEQAYCDVMPPTALAQIAAAAPAEKEASQPAVVQGAEATKTSKKSKRIKKKIN